MQSLVRILVGMPILFSLISLAQGQTETIVGLKCSGSLEMKTDGVIKRDPTSIDVLIDFRNSTASINGWWGCLNLDEKSLCTNETMPVSISDGEVKFHQQSDDPKGYSSSSSFSINRYTGTFSVFSVSFASPQSGARWRMIDASGKFNCTPSGRSF